MIGDTERNQPAPFVSQDDQDEQQPEADSWDYKEVDGGDARCMIMEESLPGLRRASPGPRHVLGDG